ncbi:hypothetical protein TrRE_jg365 [Triparma retinervis]|uniref:Uncharacterized protein n=1 Tax=Triparma retinervis TaxID=2557542 RepID=A0A9W7G1T5_9STRA|nr:hypothetical protein TrRE_jg365 [Triparma retinervis]
MRSMTPHDRAMRRLEWRWEKSLPIWSSSALSVQKLVRGAQSRALTAMKRSYKQGVASAMKIILKAGRDVTKGKGEDGVWGCDRALKVDGGGRLGMLVRGRAKYTLGDFSGARDDFSGAAGGGGEDDDLEEMRYRMVLGDRYHRPMETFEKLKVFVVATLADSFHDPRPGAVREMVKVCAYANLGRCHLKLGSPADAAACFTEVIESRGEVSDIPSMHFYRGCAYCASHSFVDAAEDFTIAVDLSPGDVENYVRRAIACWCMQDWERALVDMDTAVDMDPTSRIYGMRGRLHCCMRNWGDAVMDYKRAIVIAKGMGERNIKAEEGLRTATLKQRPLPLVSLHDA